MYTISEVDAPAHEDLIRSFNAKVKEWPTLQSRHIDDGYWWIAYLDDEPVAFAGLVEMTPHRNTGYLKRCYVCPDHHGRGLQYRLLLQRELKAKQLGWTMLVSECHESNKWSAGNFRRAGFSQTIPEQPWASNSIYWVKSI